MKKIVFGLVLALNIASLNAITVFNAEPAPALNQSAPIANESRIPLIKQSQANPYATDYRPRSQTNRTATKMQQEAESYLPGFRL